MPKGHGADTFKINNVTPVFIENSAPAINESEVVPDVSARWHRAITDLAASMPTWSQT
ncbi:hypothetical protein AB0H34_37215 [Saccharopolyspora shandongensis]|uniref:hypothetical protein n=1 Tax=Saccharopolyspora shandongensis TaxID=418495 RepID=UPI0033C8AA0A